jgi:hypothetical protein
MLAKGVNRDADSKTLERLGAELDAEAAKIEANQIRERSLPAPVNL